MSTTDVPTNYTLCARSGFKTRPHELVVDEYSKDLVLPEFADAPAPHDFVTIRSLSGAGPLRIEQEDRFVENIGETTVDDL